MKHVARAAGIAIGALLSACRAEPNVAAPEASPSTAPAPVDWQGAFQYEVRWDGERDAVVVSLEVADGFHVYTEGETIGKPLQLAMDEGGDYAIDGEVRYPKGVTKDLPIGRSVIVEGEAEIVAPLRAKTEGAGSTAAGRFRYQVCTDRACDRPRTERFRLDVAG